MTAEPNYAFRARIDEVHRPDRRDPAARPAADETAVDASWAIAFPADAAPPLRHAADDLRDYFLVSMNLGLPLAPGGGGAKTVTLEVDPAVGEPGSFRLAVEPDRIAIAGADARGALFGALYLEDQMNLREAPFARRGAVTKKRLVTPRMVHSGWGMEQYPDSHLNAIAHAGFDAVVLFISGINRTQTGTVDFADLIRRAARYGLGVMFYSLMSGYKHPDDADAEAFFEERYTRLFERFPDALGVMLVGESAEFPSKDPVTTGKKWRESVIDGVPDPRPSPGWWPCEDYPRWLKRVRDAVWKAKPGALVIFNTYNWGWTPLAVRQRFIDACPEGIVIQATFEMFKAVRREGVACAIMDYTISVDEPGDYFTTEMAHAHARGFKTLATANTAGMTWDFGCIPYVPVPQQWIRKFRALDHAREAWGVSRYYDNHHYGWWPSVVADLARAHFWSDPPDAEAHLAALAVRDFGPEAGPLMVRAWDRFSDAIGHLTPTNEDQYGPFRVGPAYPLIFHPNITRTMAAKEIDFPTVPWAHFGGGIVKTFYQPFENIGQAPGTLRFPPELRSLATCRRLWEEGLALMDRAVPLMPAKKREAGERERNLGRFMLAAIRTGIHVKTWWMENIRLQAATDAADALATLDRLEALARAEIENAKGAIPLVEYDSRLGWEPSMEYVADRWHLEWKIRQVETMLNGELAVYRGLFAL